MAKTNDSDTLGLADNLSFQRRTWEVQRVGWIIMVLISIAALLGVFGKGPFSNGRLGDDASPLRADYERFLRLNAPAQLTVYVGGSAIRPDSTVELWIDRSWLSRMEINGITPEPDKTRVLGDRLAYTFRAQPGPKPVRITFEMDNRALWRIGGELGLTNGPSYSFSQFAYP
ncbi:MAG: hypothetical protein H0U66_11270 [Gemmatimonadaceae bacterium]|nr:hypothetical protein [Gemmatimonadaceae bacterium]